jgi:hypothetical protein
MPFATSGGGALHTTNVTVSSSSPTLLLAQKTGPPFRSGFMLQNQSAIDVYWSEDPAVSTSGAKQGWLLKGNQTIPIGFTDITMTNPIYALASSGTPVITVGEIY